MFLLEVCFGLFALVFQLLLPLLCFEGFQMLYVPSPLCFLVLLSDNHSNAAIISCFGEDFISSNLSRVYFPLSSVDLLFYLLSSVEHLFVSQALWFIFSFF